MSVYKSVVLGKHFFALSVLLHTYTLELVVRRPRTQCVHRNLECWRYLASRSVGGELLHMLACVLCDLTENLFLADMSAWFKHGHDVYAFGLQEVKKKDDWVRTGVCLSQSLQ